MNLKVMLIDDEPIIMQGLSKLIDWEAEGYEIVSMAQNGKDALGYLKENEVDLIITDIRMPEMDGMEFIKQVRETKLSDAYIILLSGYSDFGYAKQAIKYNCADYILKPIQEKVLLESLHNVAMKKRKVIQRQKDDMHLRRICLEKNIFELLRGSFDNNAVEYVKEHMRILGNISYVHIRMENISYLKELADDEINMLKKELYDACVSYLQTDSDHLLFNNYGMEESYDIGLIYCDYMAKEAGMSKEEFLLKFQRRVEAKVDKIHVSLLVGKPVEEIPKISNSYSSACVLRTLKGFKERKAVYYYEEDIHTNPNKVLICKKSLDRLITAIEQNQHSEIEESTKLFFLEMEELGMEEETISMNINYLLFQLIHLAVEQDESVNQEEVMLFIGEKISSKGISPKEHNYLLEFAYEYTDYLIQLRKNASKGILQELEKEVRLHYGENLTLRELSQKYYVNSSYLGQVFRKKYGQSFKDYLCSYRISMAAKELLQTDKKIGQIAEEVGYHDTDYFITKFIEQIGCTPAKYRRNAGQVES